MKPTNLSGKRSNQSESQSGPNADAAPIKADVAAPVDKSDELAMLQQMEILRIDKQYDRAEKLIDEALRRFPQGLWALNERGLLSFEQQRYEKACEAFDRVIGIDPHNEFAWQWKLTSLRIGKQSAKADELIDEALEKVPGSAGILNERGISYFNQKQYDKAVEVFDRALEIDPNNEFAWQWKLTSLRVGNRSEEADRLIGEALEKVPGSAGILNERGISYFNQKEYDKAVEDFDRALEIDPNNEFAWQWKLTSLRIGKQSAKADELIDEALEKVPGSAGILNERGISYFNQKKYDRAVEVFDRALEIDPNNEFAWQWKLTSLRVGNRSEEADRLIGEALEKVPGSAGILNERGISYFNQKKYDRAVEDFDRALEIDPNNEFAWQSKLTSLRVGNRSEEADRLIGEALEKVPGSAGILNERGISYFNQKKYDKAVEDFDRALEIDPDNEFGWQWKLESLRLTKRIEKAEIVIKEALERLPTSVAILTQVGLLHYSQKQYDKAVEVFDRALGIDPKNEFAWQWKLTSLRVGNRSEEADRLIGEALEKVPRSAGVLNESGISYFNQKQYDKALEVFDRALGIDPNNEFAWQWKLTSLRVGNRSEEADRLIDEALEKVPGSAGILNERGISYLNQKKYDQAVKAFDKAIEIDSNNEFGSRWKIVALRTMARFSKVPDYRAIEKEVEDALIRCPDSVGLSIERGLLWSDRREYEKAATVFDNLVARFPNDEEAFVAKIDFLRNCRRTEEAASVIKKAQKALPENAQIRRELGALRFDQGRYEKATEVFDQALALDENDAFSRLWRIASLRLLGEDGAPDKFTQVENDLKQALAQTPRSTDLLIERARLCSAQQRREEADEYFEQALDVDPSDMGLRLAYAAFLTSTNRADKALEVQIKLKEEFDGQADVVEQLGWFYLGRNDYTNAEKEFVSVLDSAPLIANNGLGGVNFNRRKYTEAEAYFRKVVKAAPNHPIFKTNLAWALVRRDEKSGFSEARELCQNALALNSSYSAALGCLGVMCFKEGRLGQAEEYLRESTRVNRRQGNYTELGALYVQMGKYDDAREALKSALTNNPNDVQAHIELGNLNLQTDRNSDAITAFRLAVAIGPGNEDCHRALAIALMKVERLDEAENVVRTAIRKLDKDQVWLLYLTLAQLLTKRGDNSHENQYYEEALSEVKKAIEVRSDRAEVFLHSGIIRFKLGDFVRAWLDFRKCLNLDPGNYEAERNVKLVASRFLKESPLVKTTLLGGLGLAAICVVQLWWLWQHFLAKDNTVSEKMLLVLVPLLLGLFVVSFLLPVLVRLKLPGGFEAELTQPKSSETVSTGPKGDVGFSSAAPTASSGPR